MSFCARRFIALGLTTSGAVGLLGACSADRTADLPLVVVPNEVIADLVERVACVEPVTTVIAADGDGVTPDPVLVVTLDEAPTTDRLVVSVPTIATTIQRPGPDDAWVWLDPLRAAEVARGVAGGLAASGEFDPPLLDRCVARLDAQMEALDQELYEVTQELPDDRRTIDVSLPGTLYFANRYEFLIDESPSAMEAGRIVSTDSLGGADSYEVMMRAIVRRVVDALR
jgi:ABC-type Zn uptake system ZnuABC Zn-binding protein ZnuA